MILLIPAKQISFKPIKSGISVVCMIMKSSNHTLTLVVKTSCPSLMKTSDGIRVVMQHTPARETLVSFRKQKTRPAHQILKQCQEKKKVHVVPDLKKILTLTGSLFAYFVRRRKTRVCIKCVEWNMTLLR